LKLHITGDNMTNPIYMKDKYVFVFYKNEIFFQEQFYLYICSEKMNNTSN